MGSGVVGTLPIGPIPETYTAVAALSAISSVLQACRSYPPPPPENALSRPIPGPPAVALILDLGRGGVALPPARGVAGSLDLRNPVALQAVVQEQLHLRVSCYTLTVRL